MKRVLCISPHFPPVMGADMHRLRLSLRYFREFGWEPIVFAAEPDMVEARKDALILRTIPPDIEVHRYGAWPARLTRRAGLGNLGLRSWFHLRRAVDEYLKTHPCDLIFFTTTDFAAVAHGPRWKRRYGIPFVVDLQDPWRNDSYLELPRAKRPRKYWFDHWQRSRLEARTMPHADGIISVSSGYIETMRRRYPPLEAVPARVIPFGSDPVDFQICGEAGSKSELLAGAHGARKIAYVGVITPQMDVVVRALLLAVSRIVSTDDPLQLYFIGTAGRAGARPRIVPLAREYGIGRLVRESTGRRPYLQALRTMTAADLLLLFGSSDPAYRASKLSPIVLSGRPFFAVVHEDSDIAQSIRDLGVDSFATFKSRDDVQPLAARIEERLRPLLSRLPKSVRYEPARLEPHLAQTRAREIVSVFDEVMRNASPRAGRDCAQTE